MSPLRRRGAATQATKIAFLVQKIQKSPAKYYKESPDDSFCMSDYSFKNPEMRKLQEDERFLKKFQLLSTRTSETHQRQIKETKEVENIITEDLRDQEE